MSLKNVLKKGKITFTSLALGSALLTTGCSKENSEEPKDNTSKIEQRVNKSSDIHQNITYLDEYVSAIESGKNKEEAYQEFALKMADGNVKKMTEMQKQIETLQKELSNNTENDEHRAGTQSIYNFLGNGALLLFSFCLFPKINRELKKHDQKLAVLGKKAQNTDR